MVQAASVPLAALTAWQGLFVYGRLQAGQSVLIQGGSGGVGSFAVQFARLADAEVFVTAAGDARVLLESLGADRFIDYHNEAFEDVAKDVDLVFDLIGGATAARSWQALRRGGCFVSTVHEPDPDKVLAAGVMACRFTTRVEGHELRRIASLIEAGQVRVVIDRVFPLDRAADAERHLQNDHVKGKVVIEVSEAA
jgi:NADPH:quinone reductase-like Zn-dependent oxidoreductase